MATPRLPQEITRVAIYTRVSTAVDQSVDMQLRDLRQLAQQRGFEIVAEYSDEGVSGSKDSRPALDALLNSARRGKFQAILIWRLDRLGRSLQHLVRLFEQFRSWNVALVSFGEGLDFSTSMGKLFYQLSGAFRNLNATQFASESEQECVTPRPRESTWAVRQRHTWIRTLDDRSGKFISAGVCVFATLQRGFRLPLGLCSARFRRIKGCPVSAA